MPPSDNERGSKKTDQGESPPSLHDPELQKRLDALKSRLDDPAAPKGTPKHPVDERDNAHTRAGIAQAFRLSSEFIAGVVVGAGIGYAVDAFFGTSPWGMIIFFMLGFGAAILNVMRAAGLVAESKMRLRPAQELQKTQQDEVHRDSSTK